MLRASDEMSLEDHRSCGDDPEIARTGVWRRCHIEDAGDCGVLVVMWHVRAAQQYRANAKRERRQLAREPNTNTARARRETRGGRERFGALGSEGWQMERKRVVTPALHGPQVWDCMHTPFALVYRCPHSEREVTLLGKHAPRNVDASSA